MSHTNYKRPAPLDPRERRADRQVKVMATQIQDQGMLDKLLEGASPIDRAAMLQRIRPFLSFTPETE